MRAAAIIPAPSPAKIPPAAAGAGYNLLTFGANITLGSNWQNFNFLSSTSGTNTQNADGSVYLQGPTTYGGNIASAYRNIAAPLGWQGVAFGGGAYFECVSLHQAVGVESGAEQPVFWTMDVEHLAQAGADTWPGQPGLSRWSELDIMEWVSSDIHQFKATIWDHYYDGTVHNIGSTAYVTIEEKTFYEYNRFGILWVPATNTSQGYVSWYVNDQLVRGPFTWNLFTTSQTPPPVAGTTLGSLLDLRHQTLILGTSGALFPYTVKSASVWQASTAGNLYQ